MNDFGIELKGKKLVFQAKSFYKPGASVDERTFIAEGGPGCIASLEASFGSYMKPYAYRTITGHWQSDSQHDTISSYSVEAYINRAGNIVPRPEDVLDMDCAPIEIKPTVTGRTSPVMVQVPAQIAQVTPTIDENCYGEVALPPQPTSAMSEKVWNPARAVELFKQGMKIPDIAVEMGYPRGSGCNRTKAALAKAGAL